MKNYIRLITGLLILVLGMLFMFMNTFNLNFSIVCIGAVMILLGVKNILFWVLGEKKS